MISRTLLSKRLGELINIGLISKTGAGKGVKIGYCPTEAGPALGSVLHTMAKLGQEWIDVTPSMENVDVGYLMWRHVRCRLCTPPFFRSQQFRFAQRYREDGQIVGLRHLCHLE